MSSKDESSRSIAMPSAVILFSFFIMANYEFLYNAIAYLGLNYDTREEKTWIPITIILIMSSWYFGYKYRYKSIVKKFSHIDLRKKKRLNIIAIIYMIVSVLSVLWITYMIRNNYHLF
jgi:hypothetical protein